MLYITWYKNIYYTRLLLIQHVWCFTPGKLAEFTNLCEIGKMVVIHGFHELCRFCMELWYFASFC